MGRGKKPAYWMRELKGSGEVSIFHPRAWRGRKLPLSQTQPDDMAVLAKSLLISVVGKEVARPGSEE